MARVPLSKSQLAREKSNLASYRRYLPALDLKRQRLMAERNGVRREVARLEDALRDAVREAGEAIPMLADARLDLDGLVRLEAARLGTQNVAGVRLPVVEAVEVGVQAYGSMARPHWVDAVVQRLRSALRTKVEMQVATQRVALLQRAALKVTQRVNLFEKILIPETEENIRRIEVYLGDAERAAVVAAKLAKDKRAAAAGA